MLKFAICDDSNSSRSKCINMLHKIFDNNNVEGDIVFETSDPEKFLDYLIRNHIDVALIDIELKADLSGIDIAKKIREFNKAIYIVFITAHIEYALLAFKVKTFDYLIKPVSYEKIEECILRLVQYNYTESLDSVKIKCGSSTYMINKNDIVYIEKVNSKCYVYTVNEIIETYSTLEDLEISLPSNFQRSHKSYIVNINKISRVNTVANEVIFNNSFKCYLGRKFKKKLLEYLKSTESDDE